MSDLVQGVEEMAVGVGGGVVVAGGKEARRAAAESEVVR
jgi:hypothetical protein